MPQYIQVEATPESRKLLESLHPNISVLIQLRYRPATCDSAFCKPIPYVSVMLSQQTPAKGCVKTYPTTQTSSCRNHLPNGYQEKAFVSSLELPVSGNGEGSK